MNVSYLKDRTFAKRIAAKTEQLRREVRQTNRIRVKAPSRYVEPLDDPKFDDVAGAEKQRNREAW